MVKVTNNLWNTKQVAENYGVSKQSIMLWVNKGMPVYILGPKKFKYDPKLVEDWVIEQSNNNRKARM